jgi:hypothetical protein
MSSHELFKTARIFTAMFAAAELQRGFSQAYLLIGILMIAYFCIGFSYLYKGK